MASYKIYLLLVALSVVGLLSCRNDVDLKCDDKNTIHINQDCRDFFYFKPGTWWLYEQEGTGLTDSIWVSDASIEWDNATGIKDACKCGYGKCIEKIRVEFQNRTYNGTDFVSSYLLATELNKTTGIHGSVHGIRVAYSPLSGLWEFSDRLEIESKNTGSVVIENTEGLKVNGVLYNDVLFKHYPGNDFGNTFLKEVWFARHFFVIKFRRFDNTIWNLVDYNIVQ